MSKALEQKPTIKKIEVTWICIRGSEPFTITEKLEQVTHWSISPKTPWTTFFLHNEEVARFRSKDIQSVVVKTPPIKKILPDLERLHLQAVPDGQN